MQLIISEKPSVAGDIAKALGGYHNDADARCWRNGTGDAISWAVGHLVELQVPPGVEPANNKWSIDSLPVLPERFDLAPLPKVKSQLTALKKLIDRAHVIINACDAGREGELIFQNIIQYCGANNKPTKRMWLQSMTTDAIINAYGHQREGADMVPLGDAARARSHSDWLVGINGSRAISYFKNHPSLAKDKFIMFPVGRVQTPTLALIVRRENAINNFKPQNYWEVAAQFQIDGGGEYLGTWFCSAPEIVGGGTDNDNPERFFDPQLAAAVAASVNGKAGVAVDETKEMTQKPPLLFDLTTLQKEANKRFGFTAQETLSIAQALYEKHKLLTYPRTDSRHLPEDEVESVAPRLAAAAGMIPALHELAATAKINPANKAVFNNNKISDHFAIVPTTDAAEATSLSESEKNIYEMVARRFCAVFLPAAVFLNTRRVSTVEVPGAPLIAHQFITRGRVILVAGWLAAEKATSAAPGEESALPALAAGGEVTTTSAAAAAKQTKPPPRYTEAAILSAMENAGKAVDDEELSAALKERGLGTPATRAAIIEGLLKQEYIARQKKNLVPTPKGEELIKTVGALKEAAVLVSAELTGEWEQKLKQIERDEMRFDSFMNDIRTTTAAIVESVRCAGNELQVAVAGPPIVCPRCGESASDAGRVYACGSCQWQIWKTLYGRVFTHEELQTLCADGQLDKMDGFISRKTKKKFSAVIKLGEEYKPILVFEDNDSAGNTEVIGKCVQCNKDVVMSARAYRCTNEIKCVSIGREFMKRAITLEEAQALLCAGQVGPLAGLISKKGKPFSATLKIKKTGELEFVF